MTRHSFPYCVYKQKGFSPAAGAHKEIRNPPDPTCTNRANTKTIRTIKEQRDDAHSGPKRTQCGRNTIKRESTDHASQRKGVQEYR